MPKQQKGIALITAMIITSIAVSLAGMVMYRQQVQIRLSSNIGHFEQAYLYANGMEDWAGKILEKSFEDQPDFVSLSDPWNNEGQDIVLPITGGLMTGKLHDLHAKINLNSLNRPKKITNITPSTTNTNKAETEEGYVDNLNKNANENQNINEEYMYPAQVTRQRLVNLIANEIDPDQEMGAPENLTDILKDWVDDDQENGNQEIDGDSSGNGAESPYYQTQEPAYYSADSELINSTELRLLKDMKEEAYKKIVEHTNTLPILDKTKKIQDTHININTAKKPVLLAVGLTPDEADEIIELVKDSPFEKIEDFLESPIISNALKTESNPDGAIDPDQLDVKSNYFYLEGKVEINNARIFINSILERKNGKVSVIMRDFSNPQSITKAVN